MGHIMFAHLRILAAATGSLVLLAAMHGSFARPAPGIHETRVAAPADFQNAQVRLVTGASVRAAGF